MEIPPAYAKVNMSDNGADIKTVVVAVLVGMEIMSSDVKAGDHEGKDDTVQLVEG